MIARDPLLLGADPFFPAFIAGVELELAARSQALLLQVVGDDLEQEADRYRHLARSERVDGVFLTDLRFADPRIALLQELGLQAVTLNRPDVPSPFPAVCQDDGPGVAAAVSHLAAARPHAHRVRRGPAGHAPRRPPARRLGADDDRLGLAADLVAIADFTAAGRAPRPRARCSTPATRPTAIVYANDTMAIAGLTVAHELGFAPPRDLSLVGYEDSELAAHVYPPLTSVRSDPVAWGRTATRVLLDAIEGRRHRRRARTRSARGAGLDRRSPSKETLMKHSSRPGIAVVAALAAACGGGGGGRVRGGRAAARGPIKVWYSNNPEEVAWGKAMVTAWNQAHPNEQVTGQEIPAGKSSEEVIGAAITAGNAPCLVFNTSPAAVPRLPEAGRPGRARRSCRAASSTSRAGPGAAAEQYKSPDGKYYQLPWKANPVMIFYNKKLFEKAGIDAENPPLATYDEFLDTSRKIVVEQGGARRRSIRRRRASSTSPGSTSTRCSSPRPASSWSRTARRSSTRRAGQQVAEFWKTLYSERPRAEGEVQRRRVRRREGRDGDRRAVGDRGLRRQGRLGRRARADLRAASPPSEIQTFSDEKSIAMYSACKNRGTAWDVPQVRHLQGAGRRVPGGDRPDADAQRPARRPTRSTSTSTPSTSTFAEQAARTVEVPERRQLGDDLADLPRRLLRSP